MPNPLDFNRELMTVGEPELGLDVFIDSEAKDTHAHKTPVQHSPFSLLLCPVWVPCKGLSVQILSQGLIMQVHPMWSEEL